MADAEKKSPWIIDAQADTFQRDVVERSRELPVVVDFWAPWCQPCRLLGPILEKLAREYDGKFLLVKADIDQLPGIAGSFGVQSIPAVYGLRDGQMIDYFVGVLPEPQLRSWLDRLLPSPAEALVAEARRLDSTDPKAAEDKYRQAVELAPNLEEAKIGLARLLFAQGRLEDARKLIDELESRGFLEPEAEKIKAQLDLQMHGDEAGNVEELRSAVAADPNNPELKLKLAEALAAAGNYDEALEICLELVQKHRQDFGEKARKLMVDIFHLLPDDSELLANYRRKLSTALY